MFSYLARRLLQMIPVIMMVTIIVFGLVRLSGDAASIMLPEDATVEEIEVLQRAMGLDRPLHVQYWYFIRDAARGDFGRSFRYRMSALPLVLERLPATAELTLAALVMTVLIAIPAGVTAAIRHNSGIDFTASSLAVLGRAMPNFWVGIMLILLFGVILRWLPISGRDGFMSLVLPGITLGTGSAAMATRLMRSSMLEVLRLDYITTARAKGVSERTVIYRHALRNALIPVVTVVGVQMARLFGGALITEQIFGWPGMGRLMVDSLRGRDMAVVQAGLFMFVLMVMAANLLVDVMYTFIDPRISYQ